MDVQQVIETIRRRALMIAAVTVTCAILALVGTVLVPVSYTATARGFVSVGSPSTRSPNVMTSGSLYILARMPSYATLGTSSRVLEGVRTTLGLAESVEDLRRQVKSSAVVETAYVEIKVSGPDPTVAQRTADAIVRQLGQLVGSLENGTVDVELSNPAVLPEKPSNRAYGVNGGVAFLAGLVLGVVAAIGVDVLGRRAEARSR